MMISTVCEDGCKVPLHTLDDTKTFRQVDFDESYGLSSRFLRELYFIVHHDFDRMQDVFAIWLRQEPMSSLAKSQFKFKKNALRVVLPPRGTTERAAVMQLLSVLATFFGSINGDGSD